jgi:hypothetical protein
MYQSAPWPLRSHFQCCAGQRLLPLSSSPIADLLQSWLTHDVVRLVCGYVSGVAFLSVQWQRDRLARLTVGGWDAADGRGAGHACSWSPSLRTACSNCTLPHRAVPSVSASTSCLLVGNRLFVRDHLHLHVFAAAPLLLLHTLELSTASGTFSVTACSTTDAAASMVWVQPLEAVVVPVLSELQF